MKRFLILLALFLSILSLGLSIALWNIEFLVANSLSKKLGAPVTIKKISYNHSLLRIDQITIGNPRPSSLPHALTIGSIRLEAPLWNYLKKRIVIQRIIFDEVDMQIEFYNQNHSEGNWNSLLANLETSSTKQNSDRNAVINYLIINNIHFELLLASQKKPSTLPPIKTLRFENLETANGDLAARISEAILGHLVQAVFWKYAIPSTIRFPFDASTNALNTGFDTLKGIFVK
jgi:uncharacterized protein involved in outer membrane biogenesis